jgi:hypothetical protein
VSGGRSGLGLFSVFVCFITADLGAYLGLFLKNTLYFQIDGRHQAGPKYGCGANQGVARPWKQWLYTAFIHWYATL